MGPAGSVQVVPEDLGAGGVTQLGHRLGLDLADTLTRYSKLLSNLFKRMAFATVSPKTHTDNFLFAVAEARQNIIDLLLEEMVFCCIFLRNRIFIFDKITQH